MKEINGKGISEGIAFGKLYFYRRENAGLSRRRVEDEETELRRFEEAKHEALEALKELYDETAARAGEEQAAIFEIHQMMLEDEDYLENIKRLIREEKLCAEWAVEKTAEQFEEMFSSLEDEYMKERASDVRDISSRLIGALSGRGRELIESAEPVILVTDELMPSETVQMDKAKLLGFLVTKGSGNSHTAILARSMKIPAIILPEGQLTERENGKPAAIEGSIGKLIIEPDDSCLEELGQKRDAQLEEQALLKSLKGKENATLDGQKIKIFANAGNLEDLDRAKENDAGGIGLLRSEFLYLEKEDYPTEEEQFNIYRAAAEKMGGALTIIRTLDIGADKKAGYFNLPEEENPAMGYRAIRICLDRQELFKTQLRAIYRASAYGRIAVMFPMIISVEEIRKIKEIVEEVKAGLRAEVLPFSENMEMGIMIETPAAALISDELAREVDFFSIGTNDLTQYTLAVDRQNEKLESYYDPHHRAILKLIEMTAENAHHEGKWVGICGELAADLLLTETFLRMGIDELSVSPGSVLRLRKKVRQTDMRSLNNGKTAL